MLSLEQAKVKVARGSNSPEPLAVVVNSCRLIDVICKLVRKKEPYLGRDVAYVLWA